MSSLFAESYFAFLYGEVEYESPTTKRRRSHWALLTQLHATPFRWTVANDNNRNEDGKGLRQEYLDVMNIEPDPDILWFEPDASVLEMLIGLSRRVAFNSYSSPDAWFWKLIENLELQHCTDAHYNQHIAEEIAHILERLLTRHYSTDGRGGLFPLRDPQTNQRTTEIWYQMSAYLLEGEYVNNGP